MKSVYNVHADSLRALRRELGGDCPVMTYNGADYQVLATGAKFSRNNSAGGYTLDSDLQLTCIIADFGDGVPDSGESIIFQGGEFTIDSVTPEPGGYQMQIKANLGSKGL